MENLDPDLWPRLVAVPDGTAVNRRARKEEKRLAAATHEAGLGVAGPAADIHVHHDALFARLAQFGWLGLAEGYMAGEWEADNLPLVIRKLLQVKYRPGPGLRKVSHGSFVPAAPINIEAEAFYSLYSADPLGAWAGRFASGVPTTERVPVPSHCPGAGRGNEPAHHIVEETIVGAPVNPERGDMEDSQRRAMDVLIQLAGVRTSSDCVEFPASGSFLPGLIAHKGATVDVLTAEPRRAEDIAQAASGSRGRVSVALLDHPVPRRSDWRGHYDAVLSVGGWEQAGRAQPDFFPALERLLAPGGRAAVHAVVATQSLGFVHQAALDAVVHYIRPAPRYQRLEDAHAAVDRRTRLRITDVVHQPSHAQLSYQLQREKFLAHSDQAAAWGLDAPLRRLWDWYLSVHAALFELGALDCVQLGLQYRPHR